MSIPSSSLGREIDDNLNLNETDSMDFVSSNGGAQNYFNHSDFGRNDEAGFAAIELLRPPSHSLDASVVQHEDMAEYDDSAGDYSTQLTSQAADTSADSSYMTVEELLYQLQREIVSIISQFETLNRFQGRGISSEDGPKFIWSGRAKNLLESAIMKILAGQQELDGGRYWRESAGEVFNSLNSILLPLWPHGWMSPDELTQVIQHLITPDQADGGEMMDDSDNERRFAQEAYGRRTSSTSGAGVAAISHNSGTGTGGGGECRIAATNSCSRRIGASRNETSTAVTCFICDRSFQSPHLLKIHFSQMHTPKTLVCPHCQSRHSTLNGLRFHFSTKHKGLSQRFISELASTASDCSALSAALAESIQRQEASGGTSQFEDCSRRVTKTTPSIAGHRLPQQSLVSSDSINGGISMTTAAKEQRERDKGFCPGGLMKVNSQKTVKCKYCPNLYASQRAMLQHTYLKHQKERNCQCSECGEKFPSAGLASVHRRYAHRTQTTIPTNSVSSKSASASESSENRGSSVEAIAAALRDQAASLSKGEQSNGIRGNGKYHCRDCGVSFPTPSSVWAHRKRELCGSTSISKRRGVATSGPARLVGGQVFGQDAIGSSKGVSGKKKMRVKCSVCNAIFSNGYACYLHKKKIHGEESIRRELNLSKKSCNESTPTSATNQRPTANASSADGGQSTAATAPALSGPAGQSRFSSSSSSSRDSSPFYRAGDGVLAEGVVRRRYEFHCQCGMTFYNGFAYSRHRQRTGCSEGVRGIVVKESVCSVCSEAFANADLLNEHIMVNHTGNTSAKPSATPAVSTIKSKLGQVQKISRSTSGADGEGDNEKDRSNWESNIAETMGPTATAYVTTQTMKPGNSGGDTAGTSKSSVTAISSSKNSDQVRLHCLLCPFETVSVDALGEHGRHHQNGQKSRMESVSSGRNCCPYCSYATDSVCGYVRHAALHFAQNDQAGAAVSTSTERAKKTDQTCVYCGRRFELTSQLIEHETLHTNSK